MDAPPEVVLRLVREHDLLSGESWLGDRERGVLSRMTVPRRRRSFLLGRFAARRALAEVVPPGIAPARLAVIAAADGAPDAFLDGTPLPFALSISHAGDAALAALLPRPFALGADLEDIAPRSRAFELDYFTPAEQALLSGVPASVHALVQNLLWSAKESALKALRQGLRADTLTVEVEAALGGDDRWRSLAVRHLGAPRFQGFWTRDRGQIITVIADGAFAPPPRTRVRDVKEEPAS